MKNTGGIKMMGRKLSTWRKPYLLPCDHHKSHTKWFET